MREIIYFFASSFKSPCRSPQHLSSRSETFRQSMIHSKQEFHGTRCVIILEKLLCDCRLKQPGQKAYSGSCSVAYSSSFSCTRGRRSFAGVCPSWRRVERVYNRGQVASSVVYYHHNLLCIFITLFDLFSGIKAPFSCLNCHCTLYMFPHLSML